MPASRARSHTLTRRASVILASLAENALAIDLNRVLARAGNRDAS